MFTFVHHYASREVSCGMLTKVCRVHITYFVFKVVINLRVFSISPKIDDRKAKRDGYMQISLPLHIRHVTIVKMGILKIRKHLACIQATLNVLPGVILQLTLNYRDLVKSEYGLDNNYNHVPLWLHAWTAPATPKLLQEGLRIRLLYGSHTGWDFCMVHTQENILGPPYRALKH